MSYSIPFAMQGKDNVIAIAKGIAIILMVIGHAEAPELLTNFIYTFHMPLFFIAAGYFFKRKYLDNPWQFCVKRFKGLYVPFVTWAMVFLLLHNLFHHFGILNEQYGNWTGGVTHPYTWAGFFQRVTDVFTVMAGYDEFMTGAFWFFRGLLVASLLFLGLYLLLERRTPIKGNRAVILICLGALAFTALRIWAHSSIRIPNGGMREVWGLFFFGVGYLFAQYRGRYKQHWSLALLYFIGLCVAAKLHLHGMNNRGEMIDILTLPLTGTVGFLMTYYASSLIQRHGGRAKDLLVYIGSNTLYIFIFHIISFKAVSIIKIWYYGLDWHQIGCHMVIHHANHDDLFWVAYSIAGVALPLIGLETVKAFKSKRRQASRVLTT